MDKFLNEDEFCEALRKLINSLSIENTANIPDYIMATYVIESLKTLFKTVNARDKWFSFKPWSTYEIVSNCEVCKSLDVCKIYKNLEEGQAIVKCDNYEAKSPTALIAKVDISGLEPVKDLIIKTFKNDRIPADIRNTFMKDFNELLNDKE